MLTLNVHEPFIYFGCLWGWGFIPKIMFWAHLANIYCGWWYYFGYQLGKILECSHDDFLGWGHMFFSAGIICNTSTWTDASQSHLSDLHQDYPCASRSTGSPTKSSTTYPTLWQAAGSEKPWGSLRGLSYQLPVSLPKAPSNFQNPGATHPWLLPTRSAAVAVHQLVWRTWGTAPEFAPRSWCSCPGHQVSGCKTLMCWVYF